MIKRVDKHLSVSEELWRSLKVEAADKNVGISELISEFCVQGLKNRRKSH